MDARCVGCKTFPGCDPDDCDILKLRLRDGDDEVPGPCAVMGGQTQAAYPDNNPKTVLGIAKPGISCVPPSSLLHLGRAMADGEKKYGLMNWREKTVSSSFYVDAAFRHLMAWWDGEEVAPDSGVHHLGHVMACMSILLDAQAQGNLNDNRPVPGQFPTLVKQFTKPTQAVSQ